MAEASQAHDAAREEGHARLVGAMFGRIAKVYDLLNRVLSLGLDRVWRRRLVELTRPGDTGVMLDLAAGTLDVSLELTRQHKATKVMALDFSAPMLATGARKLTRQGLTGRVQPVQADGRTLPLPEASVDAATIAFGIRNILPRQAAFDELYRVLAPGGRLCVLEFGTGKERIWGGLYNFYLGRVLPGIGKLVSRDGEAYAYLARTIREFPAAEELADELRQAGFTDVGYRALCSGIVYLHWGDKPA